MTTRHHVKTPAEARADFVRRGEAVTSWAHEHGYSPSLVFEVLRGRIKGRRGKAHEIAVLLGMKEGVIERRNRHKYAA
jgi:gp16 family phage-associated protein